MTVDRKVQKVNFFLVLKSHLKFAVIATLMMVIAFVGSAFFTQTTYLFSKPFILLLMPIFFIVVLLLMCYQGYRLGRILKKSFGDVLEHGFIIEQGSNIRLVVRLAQSKLAISHIKIKTQNFLLLETFIEEGKKYDIKISSSHPLIYREIRNKGIWFGEKRKVRIRNGKIENAKEIWLQAMEDFRSYGLLQTADNDLNAT